MDVEAAKYIGAGLATLPLIGVGVGLGLVFGNFLSGALRNPDAAPSQQANMYLGFAITEATGLFGLVVSFLILFS